MKVINVSLLVPVVMAGRYVNVAIMPLLIAIAVPIDLWIAVIAFISSVYDINLRLGNSGPIRNIVIKVISW